MIKVRSGKGIPFSVAKAASRGKAEDNVYFIHEPSDLVALPNGALHELYAAFGGQAKITDRTELLRATWKLLGEDVASTQFTIDTPNRENGTMAKATKKSTAKKGGKKGQAKKAASKAASRAASSTGSVRKGPGVIGTIKSMMERKNGASVNEIMERLQANFPERSPDSMIKTARIQVRRLYKTLGIKPDGLIEDSESRGRVYRLPSAE